MNSVGAQLITPSFGLIEGNCLLVLPTMEESTVQTCITSPPYWGVRRYLTASQVWGGDRECKHEWGGELRAPWANKQPGPNTGGLNGAYDNGRRPGKGSGEVCCKCGAWLGELGSEPTPDLYVAHIVEVFRAVRRVLCDDGTLWLNMGDTYANPGKGGKGDAGRSRGSKSGSTPGYHYSEQANRGLIPGLKHKDLVGIPWRVALALQADGWHLRCDVVWSKSRFMPESTEDRPTRTHEYIFLLSKQPRYYYNADAIREPLREKTVTTFGTVRTGFGNDPLVKSHNWRGTKRKPRLKADGSYAGANCRSVWELPNSRSIEGHYATYPEKLVERPILAGSRQGDTVLDPFSGTGTTGLVALRLGRNYVGIELLASYCDVARRRLSSDAPMFNTVAE